MDNNLEKLVALLESVADNGPAEIKLHAIDNFQQLLWLGNSDMTQRDLPLRARRTLDLLRNLNDSVIIPK